MINTTTRVAALAAALLFGAATIVPSAWAQSPTQRSLTKDKQNTAPAETPAETPSAAPSTTAPAEQPETTQPSNAMPSGKMSMHHHKGMHHHMAGGSNAHVKAAQEALNKEGANLAVDGKFGPKTRAAIKSYQQAHNLKATGHLDKATKAALQVM